MVAHDLDDGGRGELRRCDRGSSYHGRVRRRESGCGGSWRSSSEWESQPREGDELGQRHGLGCAATVGEKGRGEIDLLFG